MEGERANISFEISYSLIKSDFKQGFQVRLHERVTFSTGVKEGREWASTSEERQGEEQEQRPCSGSVPVGCWGQLGAPASAAGGERGEELQLEHRLRDHAAPGQGLVFLWDGKPVNGRVLFGWLFLLQPGFYFTKLSSLYFSESILVPLPGSPDCKPCPGFYPSFRHSPPLSLILPRSSFHLCVLSREVMSLLLTF